MIKFATATVASLTEMWCLQLIGEIVHKAQTLVKSTDEALKSWNV